MSVLHGRCHALEGALINNPFFKRWAGPRVGPLAAIAFETARCAGGACRPFCLGLSSQRQCHRAPPGSRAMFSVRPTATWSRLFLHGARRFSLDARAPSAPVVCTRKRRRPWLTDLASLVASDSVRITVGPLGSAVVMRSLQSPEAADSVV